jgi:hypothetical protein
VDHDLVQPASAREVGDEAHLGGDLGVPAARHEPRDAGLVRRPRLVGDVPGDVLGEVRQDGGDVAAAEGLVDGGDGPGVRGGR